MPLSDCLRRGRRPHSARFGAILCAVVWLNACGGSAGTLTIPAERPGSRIPLAGLQVTVLPVDAQALLDTLARRAGAPKPAFPALETEMRAFRLGQDVTPTGDGPAERAWQDTRDSLETLADTLRGLDRASVAYRDAYERLRKLYDHLGQRAVERDRSRSAAGHDDRDLALRAARAADSLRRWEQATYTGFPQELRAAVRRTGRDCSRSLSKPRTAPSATTAPWRRRTFRRNCSSLRPIRSRQASGSTILPSTHWLCHGM